MNGILLSQDDGLQNATDMDLVVDSRNPFWMCDLRANPKHFGLVKANFSAAAFGTKTILSVNHFYTTETPSFIVAWSYPAGTNPSSSTANQTFGIGSFEIQLSVSHIVKIKCSINSSQFRIVVDNTANAAGTGNLYGEFRYYIFAQGWPPLKALS